MRNCVWLWEKAYIKHLLLYYEIVSKSFFHIFHFQDKKEDTSSAKLLSQDTNQDKSEESVILGEQSNLQLMEEADSANAEMNKKCNQKSSIQDLLDNQTENKNTQSDGPRRVNYPYWSWAPCFDCRMTRPPRCHHCPICKKCVLKRDHHCWFAGACVGYRNMKFYLVFLIWAWTGTMYATLHGFPYISTYLWQDMSYADVLFPIAIIRYLFGYISLHTAGSVITLTLLLYFDMLTTMLMVENWSLLSNGWTSFEKAYVKRSLEIRDTRTSVQRIRAVFGKRWILCFFIPVHFFTEAEEDPIEWPDIKVFKHHLIKNNNEIKKCCK